MEVDPLSIILVKSDSKGDRLLFRYPFNFSERNQPSNVRRRSPYAIPNLEDLLLSSSQPISNINKGQLCGFTDEVLSSLFAVKSELTDKKFELKVNDVRFVGHPTLLNLRNKQQDASGLMLINVVFALQALSSHSVVTCYHDLSKRMGIALKYEEKRCGYVSEQTQMMTTAHDDGCATNNSENAFQVILEKCTLAGNIKKVYGDLCFSGIVNIQINKWITLSFCLPQKVHQWHLRDKIVEPRDIDRCLRALRPYHSLLLLHPIQQMADFTGLDGSPSLERMLKQYSPIKNLQTIAADADLTLNHVFELTAHLVYWAKATVIFPICLTNKYVISPDAQIHLHSPLVDKFSEMFPGSNLIRTISDFALPTSLGQKCNPLCNADQQNHLVQTIIWMLQHHLLLQLHTYVQYAPTDDFLVGANLMKNDRRRAFQRSAAVSESESSTSTPSDLRSESELLSRSINLDNVNVNSFEEEKQDYQEELLLDFPDDERGNIFKIPATNNPEDLRLFARLCRKGYFHGQHHIEEIMYLENLRRSQLLQLLDKFRDVLITYETEDPTIAMFPYS